MSELTLFPDGEGYMENVWDDLTETQVAVLENPSRLHLAPRSTLAVLIRKGLVSERPSGPPFRTRRGADLIEWADRAGLL